uniref:Dishevelled-binding antagonist of beta-catenin 3a n=1 Tax=Sander lucioperca TaxID=283035 RepID=A0A8C9XV37_SANLU
MRDVDPSQEEDQQAQKLETYIFGLIQRRALPTRSSKPRTSLAHDARAVNVVRQSSLCRKEEQRSPKQVSVQEISTPSQCSEGTVPQACHNLDQQPYLGSGFTEDVPRQYHHNLQQGIQHQPGLYCRPRQAPMINTSCSTLLDYPSCRVLQAQPDSSNSESDSPQHFHNYPSPPAMSKPHQPLTIDEQLVNAEYIPAQPCRQPTASQIQPSRSRGGPKKCRSNEDKNGAGRKPGKKACRSQSENSLQRVPERKYNTVERDGGGSGSGGRGSRSSQTRSKKQQQGGSCRRWQSTLELSQDEADQPPMQIPVQGSSASNQKDNCARRTLPLRQPSEDYPHPRLGESESSMSEADSPDSSSLSSDSDESGGLVWPQQLPPQLSLPSPSAPPGAPLQPKAFIKIKASHALKKKILRFRTGSLKVMTTV